MTDVWHLVTSIYSRPCSQFFHQIKKVGWAGLQRCNEIVIFKLSPIINNLFNRTWKHINIINNIYPIKYIHSHKLLIHNIFFTYILTWTNEFLEWFNAWHKNQSTVANWLIMTESIVEHYDAAQESFYIFGAKRIAFSRPPWKNSRKCFMKCTKVQSCTSSWQQSKFLLEWELLVSDVIIGWIFYWIISVNHHLWLLISD